MVTHVWCGFALLLIVASAGAQPPAPRAEAAFRASTKIGLRDDFDKAQPPTGLGSEILLMQESRPFIVKGGIAPSYTTNAFSDYTESGSWVLEGNLGVAVESLIAGKVFLHAEIGSAAARYDRHRELDRDSFAALVSASVQATDRITVAGAWVGQWYMESGFGENYLTFHTFSARANYRHPVGPRLVLNVLPYVNWIRADPSDYDQLILGGSIGLTLQHSSRIQYGLYGQVGWSDYDHYFRGLFPKDRRDLNWSVNWFYSHRITDQLEFRADIRFARNDSNLVAFDLGRGEFVGLYDYDTWQFTPSLGLNWQF